jgi:ribose/xylose/arabinose/galactoside ABC-type transport system permease subunit
VKESLRSNLYQKLRGYIIVVLLLVLCVVTYLLNPKFATVGNFANILVQSVPIAIGACGMTFAMIAGGFDLSVGSIAAMAGMVAASLAVRADSPTSPLSPTSAFAAAVASALVVGLVLGWINGLLIARVRINPFVTTLGTMLMVRSLVEVYSGGGKPIHLEDKAGLGVLAWGHLLGVPNPIWILAAALLIAAGALRWTRFGYYCYALGGNERAAWLSGINTDAIKTLTYVLTGGTAGLAGLIVLSRVSQAEATAATGYELDVIAAVIIGGTPLGGGTGSILGSFIGVLTLGVINNLLVFLNVDPSLQKMVKGAIIVGAVGLDSLYRARRGAK